MTLTPENARTDGERALAHLASGALSAAHLRADVASLGTVLSEEQSERWNNGGAL